MVSRTEFYRRVNSEWPESLPVLSAEEAIRAGRRLYRFVTGRTWTGTVKLTTGNRANDIRRGVMFVSTTPRYGRHPWDNLVHEFSHRLASYAGVDPSHSKDHARLERRMVKEVVDRGWLDGALRDEAKPDQTREEKITEERATRLARIDVLIMGWERKARRADTALRKLHRQRKRAAKTLEAPIPPEPAKRARKLSPRQEALALAAEYGLKIEVDHGIERKPIWVGAPTLDEDDDPHCGDHWVDYWSDALARAKEYVAILAGAQGGGR